MITEQKNYNDIFIGEDWSSVGSDVAKAFFGTRKRTEYTEVTKYRDEEYISDYKDESYQEYDDSTTTLLGTILLTGLLLWAFGVF